MILCAGLGMPVAIGASMETIMNTIRMTGWEYETALAWDGMAWEQNADVSARALCAAGWTLAMLSMRPEIAATIARVAARSGAGVALRVAKDSIDA